MPSFVKMGRGIQQVLQSVEDATLSFQPSAAVSTGKRSNAPAEAAEVEDEDDST